MSRRRDEMTYEQFWEKWMPEIWDEQERAEFVGDLRAVVRMALRQREQEREAAERKADRCDKCGSDAYHAHGRCPEDLALQQKHCEHWGEEGRAYCRKCLQRI